MRKTRPDWLRFEWPRDWRRDVRTFVAGGGCGFIAGALFVFVALSQANLIVAPWSPAARAVDGNRVTDAVVEPADGRPTATSGRAVPSPVLPEAGGHSIGPDPSSPAELKDRRLQMPVDGVSPNQLVRQFSDARSGHKHEAIDILAPRNTPVRAVEDGTIARLFISKAGGITVYQFDPSGAFCYYYAHLERYADGLREGQSVSRGQLLGYVGTSGNAPKDTPHLHFAIFRLTEQKRWWEGTPIDPYDVLR
jgi:murein DD-endopeptidase MepM/ murein hydrolase activator NlpD